MASLRSLPDGCASATSFVVGDASNALTVVDTFLAQVGSVNVEDFARRCSVEHPDGLRCALQAEVFMLPSGACLLEVTRMCGDCVLFSLVIRLYKRICGRGQCRNSFLGNFSRAVELGHRLTRPPCLNSCCLPRPECYGFCDVLK